MKPWYRAFRKEICVGQEVYCTILDCAMKVGRIRVDSSGRPLFTLEFLAGPMNGDQYVARFEEIKEIF